MADRPNNRGRKSRKKVCGFCVDKVGILPVFAVICPREERSFPAV